MILILLIKYLIFFEIVASQINLYFTDEKQENINDIVVQHICFYYESNEHEFTEITPFCLSESISKWRIDKPNTDSIFTFTELSKRNITSEQLYNWSAHIDIIEQYEFYLNQLLIGNQSSNMDTQLYYNCSAPTFGPQCQFQLDVYDPTFSLNENIYRFFSEQYFDIEPVPLTCYTHLQCDRGLSSLCLDWTEICDGIIDCKDGIDEKDCWLFTTNICQNNEYRCLNGQCALLTFRMSSSQCLDGSDKKSYYSIYNTIPTAVEEDTICSWRQDWTRLSLDNNYFTSSCKKSRHTLIKRIIFSVVSNTITNDNCLLAFQCYTQMSTINIAICLNLCVREQCLQIINSTCPNMFFYPTSPIAFSHIYFAYTKQYIINSTTKNFLQPEYICYNEQMCNGFSLNVTLLSFQGKICRRPEDFPLILNDKTITSFIEFIQFVYSQLSHCNTIIYDNSTICQSSYLYRCQNSSKCIPMDYINDGIRDCDYNDDEQQDTIDKLCRISDMNVFYKCLYEDKCISQRRVGDGKYDCGNPYSSVCDDEILLNQESKDKIRYRDICSGYINYNQIEIDGQLHTDETDCDQWPCYNRMTRCNYISDCPNGTDEYDCPGPHIINSLPSQYLCISLSTNELTSLPIEKINDGTIDCLGRVDEPQLCSKNAQFSSEMLIYCENNTHNACVSWNEFCSFNYNCNGNFNELKKFCEPTTDLSSNLDNPIERINFKTNNKKIDSSDKYYCHYGLPVQVLLNNDKGLMTKACFCPQSYYGNRCQYQNQRASLVISIYKDDLSSQIPFVFLISLVVDDSNQRIIHSYRQISSLYNRVILEEYILQLVYSTQPKDLTKKYFVHIDIYETVTLKYRGSIFIELKFPFLPVERVAIQIHLPKATDIIQTCWDHQCINGQCVHYLNKPNKYFCRCQSGWTGQYCQISHVCSCSLDSLCTGITVDNRSICVCPMNKFGPKCLLTNNACQENSCQNGGLCLLENNYLIRGIKQQYRCICPKGYRGPECEVIDKKIIITLDKNSQFPVPIYMFFYFIDFYDTKDISSVVLCPHQTSITIYSYEFFYDIIAKISFSDYYLIVNNTLNLSYRCQSVRAIFNESIVGMHLLRRLKYYNIPCRNRLLNLLCFYDDIYVCVCRNFDEERLADCVEIEHLEWNYNRPMILYEEIDYTCSPNKSIQLSTLPTSSSIPSTITISIGNAMASIYTGKYFLCFFIFIFCLF